MAPDPSLISLRVNDNQRETVTQTLNDMYQQGYLPLDEYEQRTNAALRSINQAQLRYLLRDLPDTPDTQTLFDNGSMQPAVISVQQAPVQITGEDGMATSSEANRGEKIICGLGMVAAVILLVVVVSQLAAY